MGRLMMVLWGLAMTCAVAGAGRAETTLHDGDAGLHALRTADDSRGWGGVGRLNLGDRGFCTAALISEELVLTAAHCLFDSDTGARVDDDTLEFLAGWRDGRAEAYRGVRRSAVHPDYHLGEAGDMDLIGRDMALLELDRPIRSSHVTPFATGPHPAEGGEVGVVSYARERSDRPSLQQVCHVLGSRDSVLVLSCDVDFGSSGAPIFDMLDGEARIVSVVAAKARVEDEKVSLGSSVESGLGELRAILAKGDGVFHRAAPTVRRLSSEAAREGSSAKFVRP